MNPPLLTVTVDGPPSSGRSLLMLEIVKLLEDKGLVVWVAESEHEIKLESPSYLETITK